MYVVFGVGGGNELRRVDTIQKKGQSVRFFISGKSNK